MDLRIATVRPLIGSLALALLAATFVPATAASDVEPTVETSAAERAAMPSKARPTAEPETTVAESKSDPRMRRIAGATQMTRGCVDTKSKVISHRKSGKACGKGKKAVSFTPKDARTVCLQPSGTVKLSKSKAACKRSDGFQVHALGNHKNLYCIRPGRAIRWVPYPEKCTSSERRYTLRNTPPADLTLDGGTLPEDARVGSAIGSLTAIDPDKGDAHRFRLVGGKGSGDNAKVRLDGTTLYTRVTLDHEQAATLSIRVRTADARKRRFEKAFTLRVSDVAEAPADLTLTGTEVAENRPAGAFVGTLSARDNDRGESLTYALVAGEGDADNALFALDGTRMVTAAVLDHEKSATRTVRVKVTDRSGLSQEKAFTITVGDVNDVPTRISLAADEVAENAPAGTAVGDLVVDDEDPALPYSFALVAGDGDTGNAFFEVRDGALVTQGDLDFEAARRHAVRVRVTDAQGETLTGVLTVHVLDRAEAPDDLTLDSRVVEENQPAGTVVGRLGASDPDHGEVFTFSLDTGAGDDDNADFVVRGNQLRTASPLDHEAKATRTVRLKVTDSSDRSFSKRFEIDVTDVNDAPHGLRLDPGKVDEHTAAGTSVGAFAVDDEDAGAPYRFTLVSGDGDGDNDLFRVVGGELHTSAELNHEEKATRSVHVLVTDSDGLTFDTSLTIRVVDVKEAPRQLRLSDDSVDENSPVGTPVGTLSAADPDGDTLTYALTAGTGDADNGLFRIVGDELQTTAVLDHEEKATRSIRVTVADPDELSVTEVWTITVADLDEKPGAPQLSNAVVAENAADTVVGTLSADDADTAETQDFTLVTGAGSNDNGLFRIVGDELRTDGALDHELGATRTVRVRVTDSARLFEEASFTITVGDVDEAPHSIAIDGDEVDENADGALVGTAEAVDPEGRALLWTLVDGYGDNAFFELDGRELRTAVALDHETKATHDVRLQVVDGIHVRTLDVTVKVRDANDAPSGFALDNTSINENVTGKVGTLSALDQDGDTLDYDLVAGAGDADNAEFEVVGDELRTRRGLDFEDGDSRSVRLRVSDGADVRDLEATISVVDVNETPSKPGLDTKAVDENAANTRVGTLSAVDPDGDALTFELVDGALDNALFTIVDDELRTRAGLDFEQAATRQVRVRVVDRTPPASGGLDAVETFTITVRDRNDAPTAITLSNLRVRQDSAVGDVVGTLSATDQDATSTHTFTDVSLAGVTNGYSYFSVEGRQVKVARDLSALPVGALDLLLRVEDLSASPGPDQSFTQVVTLDLLEPRRVSLTPNSLPENSSRGAVIGGFAYLDGLHSGAVSFSLPEGEADNDDFFLRSATELAPGGAFDHESTPTRTILVRVTGDGVAFDHEVVVSITDVDEAPSAVVLTGDTVAENAPDAFVGTLAATDPERRPVTYALAAPAADNDNAEFVVDGNELRVDSGLDFESGETRTVAVVASAGAGAPAVRDTTTVVTVTVTDVNEKPTAITLSEDEVLSSMPTGTEVGRLDVTDVDGGGTRTYTFAPGGNPDGLFAIDGDRLITDARLLDEVGEHEVEVVVEDTWRGSTLTRAEMLTVTVKADTSLTLAPGTLTIAENESAGTVVAQLEAAGGTSPYTYALVSGGDEFALTAAGALTSRARFDHEAKSSYPIAVRVTDAADRRWEIERTVTVTNVVEPITHRVTGVIRENDADASITVEFSNPDGLPFDIASDVVLEAPTAAVFIKAVASATTMVLKVKAAQNFEARYRVPLTFRYGTTVVDGEVLVQDVNDPASSVDTWMLRTLSASTPVGTVYGNVHVNDPDSRKPTIALTSVPGTHNGAGLFALDGTQLKVVGDLSLVGSRVAFQITASDTWGDPAVHQSQDFAWTIVVEPALTSDGPTTMTVQENTSGQSVELGASGGVAPYVHEFVDSGDSDLFSLSGGELHVSAPLDFETKAQHPVKVRITDSQGATIVTTVTVNVTDVNESPSPIAWDGPTSLAENSAPGRLGTATSTDPDGYRLYYSLVDPPAGLSIDVASGVVSTLRSFDHEAEPQVTFTVRAIDAGGLSVLKTFTVEVTDVNEKPSITSAAALTVPEEEAVGSTLLTLTASDPDADETLSWSLNTTGPFTLDGDKVKLSEEFDAVRARTHTLTVAVSDGELSDTRTVTVTVIPTPPTVTGESFDALGNTPIAPSVSLLDNDTVKQGTLKLIVADSGSTEYGRWAIDGNGMFTYSPDAGVRDTTDTITYRVTSSNGGSTTGQVKITILPRVIWYVDQAAAAGGDGTKEAPVRDFPAVTTSAAGDDFDVASGVYAQVALKANQRIFGPRVALPGFAFGPSLRTANPSGVAQLTSSVNAPAVALSSGNVVNGVDLVAAGKAALAPGTAGTSTIGAQTKVLGATGPAIEGPQGSRATLVVNAPVTGAGRTINVSGTASTFSFNGPVTTTPMPGQTAVAADGASVTFSGGLVVDSGGTAIAFTRGSLAVIGAGNTVASAGGDALALAEADIDPVGIRLARAHAPHGALQRTGTSVAIGGITVTGGTAAGSGGTLRQINLNRIDGAVLNRVAVVASPALEAVRADALSSGLTLSNSSVSGGKGDAVRVTGSNGATALVLQDVSVTDPGDSAVVVTMSASAAAVTVTGSTFSTSLTGGSARDGIRVETSGSGAPTVTVTGSSFNGFRGDAVQVSAAGRAASPVKVNLSSNTVSDSAANGQGFLVNGAGDGWMGEIQATIDDNTIKRVRKVGVALSTSGKGTLHAGVTDNEIGMSACDPTLGLDTVGVLLDAEDYSKIRALVERNQITVCKVGVDVVALNGTPDIAVTQVDNTLPQHSLTLPDGDPGKGGLTKVRARAGVTCTDLQRNTGAVWVSGFPPATWKYVRNDGEQPTAALKRLNPNAEVTVASQGLTPPGAVTSCILPTLN